MIPKNISHLKFCKVARKSKVAVEDEWQKHQLSQSDIEPWIAAGNNYGIICSDGVGMIDADHREYVMAVENLLPETFSVESSSSEKRHFYYKIIDFPADKKKISFIDPDKPEDRGAQGGDVRLGNFYVIGPGSIHPKTGKPYVVVNDVPIAEVHFDRILEVLGPYFKTSIVNPEHKSCKTSLPIQEVVDFYKIPIKVRNKGAVECFCAHPIHGSEGGTNFGVNLDKDAWFCRRHNVGGYSFQLVALMERLIDCADMGTKMSGDIHEKVVNIIKEKFGRDFSVVWDSNKDGSYRPTYNNVLNFLESKNTNICLNEFSDDIEFDGRKYSDRDSLTIKEHLRAIRCEPAVKIIDEAVVTYAKRNSFHPIRDYLSKLVWDGVPRATSWLIRHAGAEDTDYSRFVSTCILVSAVKRVFEPGCQYDHMPILEGDQGIGKSKIVRTLGGQWYKEVSMTERDKDTVQKMQGAWFIEVAELAAFAKRDIDSLKAFITVQVDGARFAYARNDHRYPRQSTFIGTINPESIGYLLDKTGNRRFLPILLKNINIDAIAASRDQLFAEAVKIYKAGFKIYIDDAALAAQATHQQESREEQDDWAHEISLWANNSAQDIGRKFTTCDVYCRCLGGKIETYNPRTIGRRIGNILRKLGCPAPVLFRDGSLISKQYDISPIIVARNTASTDWIDEL